jgi:hypothetical protein
MFAWKYEVNKLIIFLFFHYYHKSQLATTQLLLTAATINRTAALFASDEDLIQLLGSAQQEITKPPQRHCY